MTKVYIRRIVWGGLAILVSGTFLYLYMINRCSPVAAQRPLFGVYTLHCLWDHGIKSMEICEQQTTRDPKFDPLTNYLVRRLAKRAAAEALSRAGGNRTFAEVDVETYGIVIPCDMRVLAVEATNPNVISVPRVGFNPPHRLREGIRP